MSLSTTTTLNLGFLRALLPETPPANFNHTNTMTEKPETHKERLVQLLMDAGIAYNDIRRAGSRSEVRVYGGYVGFFTVFVFDRDCNLESIEAYE